MKKLFVLLTCAASFAECHTSSGPGFDQSAVMPKAGSQFTYQVVAPQGQLQEITTIKGLSNNTFTASRQSDTVNGFWTSGPQQYLLLSSGDLLPLDSATLCGCDSSPLPIASHKLFDPPDTGPFIPTKLNGFVDNNSSVTTSSQYEGEVTILAAGTNFQCSQVSKSVTIIAISPNATANGQSDTTVITHRYWYSSAIGFFVKDQVIAPVGDSSYTNFTRTLVSYK
jgi:hypothetical protein